MLLGVLLVAFVFWYSGPEEVVRAVLRVSPVYFVLLLFLQLFMMLLWALKWWIVVRHLGVSFRSIFLVSSAGYLFNNLTPVNMLGGEPVMAYLLPKVDKNINTERSAASIVVNTFFTLFPVLGLALLAVALGLDDDVSLQMGLPLFAGALVVGGVLVVSVFFLVRLDYSRYLVAWTIGLLKRLPVGFLRAHALDAERRVDSIIENFNDSMRKSMADRGVLLLGVCISTVIWAIYILQTKLIFDFMGFSVPVGTVVRVKIAAIVIGFFSITPGAVGIWEGVNTWLFSLYAIPLSTATAAVFIERFFSFWVGNVIGLLAIVYIGASYLLEKYV
ncbi:MAG: flippase-like domain-containing protein [Candidatus Altiarchaeota archaeon]|nr:flippase-like domain-containing protein [Candidatus Altiarchaeota archaeon]